MNTRRIGEDDFLFTCTFCGSEEPIVFHVGHEKEHPMWACYRCVDADA